MDEFGQTKYTVDDDTQTPADTVLWSSAKCRRLIVEGTLVSFASPNLLKMAPGAYNTADVFTFPWPGSFMVIVTANGYTKATLQYLLNTTVGYFHYFSGNTYNTSCVMLAGVKANDTLKFLVGGNTLSEFPARFTIIQTAKN